jgi:hypothetical protein
MAALPPDRPKKWEWRVPAEVAITPAAGNGPIQAVCSRTRNVRHVVVSGTAAFAGHAQDLPLTPPVAPDLIRSLAAFWRNGCLRVYLGNHAARFRKLGPGSSRG